MVFWFAVAGLLVWVSFEFLLRRPGDARQSVGPADVGDSTRVLLVSFLISLVISLLLSGFRIGVAPMPIRWAGFAILVCGLGLRAWSMAILGSRYSRGLQVMKRQELVTTGPYRLIRHPGYAGSLLVWIGYAIGAGSWAAAVLISLVVGGAYLYRIAAEERMLSAEFGAPYQIYQQRTCRLIPGLF
jgi:protein-S-isoprenylcysteine O-methyltransferase Ste14